MVGDPPRLTRLTRHGASSVFLHPNLISSPLLPSPPANHESIQLEAISTVQKLAIVSEKGGRKVKGIYLCRSFTTVSLAVDAQ